MANPNPSPSTRFKPGQSGNPAGGNRRHVFTKALFGKLTPKRAERIAERVLSAAEAGEAWAIAMAWDRAEGKAVARTEDGAPGDFDLDLSDVDTKTLKAAFKRVK